ncbi:MAG: stage III sporulation protein AA [Syntrophomonas sp.]|uniref:stage III sporulation protein AA n=1 Tax=Syntrophomonas sp. TaxID=2053627 RepID=UPI00262987B8|nr:stage III sporulation protein AA [Syntrophomonas sp.]MDD2510238.1 stage III sporulation protein AA [Syntrophomonas sp.]MDD3878796.1 stage III sporulation protein AA [Syntrophomonas sp.]MDD4626822.1 stage III sporulation protein AA [Syntrophomonas sp.]
MDGQMLKQVITPYFTGAVKEGLSRLKAEAYRHMEEIRLRAAQPLLIKIGESEWGLTSRGELTEKLPEAITANREDLYRTIASISDNSLYAFEEEIRRGFITIPGGHRVGLAGQVIVQAEGIKGIKEFSSICFRLAREKKGCAQTILPHIISSGNIVNTLIISPPRCGKTTILRDIARSISTGYPACPPHNIAIIDERSEIAGTHRGLAQLDVGARSDVLDACPKAWGMMMAIRSLSPQVLIADEIGRKEDVEALQECINAGVAVICSIHARNLEEVKKRPLTKELLSQAAFRLGVVLSRRNGPGTVEEIIRWD